MRHIPFLSGHRCTCAKSGLCSNSNVLHAKETGFYICHLLKNSVFSNMLDYGQNMSEYVARMYQLQTTDPEAWLQFLSKDFTVNTSNKIPFTRLGIDHAQEQVNKNLKGQGAISGITQYPATLLKFCMCAPELSRIVEETEAMVGMPNQNSTEHHLLNHITAVRKSRLSQICPVYFHRIISSHQRKHTCLIS